MCEHQFAAEFLRGFQGQWDLYVRGVISAFPEQRSCLILKHVIPHCFSLCTDTTSNFVEHFRGEGDDFKTMIISFGREEPAYQSNQHRSTELENSIQEEPVHQSNQQVSSLTPDSATGAWVDWTSPASFLSLNLVEGRTGICDFPFLHPQPAGKHQTSPPPAAKVVHSLHDDDHTEAIKTANMGNHHSQQKDHGTLNITSNPRASTQATRGLKQEEKNLTTPESYIPSSIGSDQSLTTQAIALELS